GEPASYRGFPPSVSNLIMALAERAGPGPEGTGDITGIFSVLVAGSDMDEPVADILRGTLDGHVVLERSIAERGRFPAIDVVRSVSRSLPDAASGPENAMIARARAALGAYGESELMIRAGLYAPGSDPKLDEAVKLFPQLDDFVTKRSSSVTDSFAILDAALRVPMRHRS
ncbi:MAG: flagellum-specific ATP synthase FliI, partial [Alphaproteobacteria bacterium]|nr:flagellum-specific ATP synthase FliI [Alphaproteobacteria bacterium]